MSKLTLFFGIIPTSIDIIVNVLITAIGLWLCMQGEFTVGNDHFVVDKGGRSFSEGSVTFYKSSKNTSDLKTSNEMGITVLKIQDTKLEHDSSYTICTGKVKNTGNKTYYFVEVKGSFKDSSGNIVDTDSTYAAGSEGLAPNESSSFRLSVSKDRSIHSCSVSILDYD